MAIVLQAFTTPANTQVIADTAAPLGSLPTPAVPTAATAFSPLIDGSNAYIWSPNNAPNQTVTFRSTFSIGSFPFLTVALPISVYYAYAANETATVTATLEVVNLLGIVVATIPLFSGSSSDSQNVDISQADILIALGLLGNTGRIIVDATVSTTTQPGRYLGQITVRDFLL